MAFMKYGTKKTYYEVLDGRKDAIPLICLHGGPGATHRYFEALRNASMDRKVVLYDQIGTGRSSPLKQKDQTITAMVDDLARLIRKLKISKFHLLGTSWGATLALEYYFRKQGRGVSSLILQSPFVSTAIWEKDANALLRKLPRQTQKVIKYCTEVGATDSKVYKSAEKEFYAKHCYRGKTSKENIEYNRKYPNPHGQDLYQYMWGPSEFVCSGTLKNYERFGDLKKIEAPTLYLAGQYDEVRRETLMKFKRATPNSQAKIIARSSHTILRENPTAMIKVMNKFLNELE